MGTQYSNDAIPMPPEHLRRLVGQASPSMYENPTGRPVFGEMPFTGQSIDVLYRSVYDFGCGCGRQARQLLLQQPTVGEFTGIDISRVLIDWCRNNITPVAPNFRFYHHDVYNATYASDNSRRRTAPLQGDDASVTLFNAHSVFTHMHFDQAEYYLSEAKRLLARFGVIRSTWLLVDKRVFPQMHGGLHCVYIQENDPTQAVFYDWRDTISLVRSLGFAVLSVDWTQQYGKPNTIFLGSADDYQGKDIANVLSPPSTIVGSDATPGRLAGHESGWRAARADDLVRQLKQVPGVVDIAVEPATYSVSVRLEPGTIVDDAWIDTLIARAGFRRT